MAGMSKSNKTGMFGLPQSLKYFSIKAGLCSVTPYSRCTGQSFGYSFWCSVDVSILLPLSVK